MTFSEFTDFLPEILLSVSALTITVVCALLTIGYNKKKRTVKLDAEEIDKLDGYDFEEFAAFLLKGNGAEIISLTKKSGDFGADIIIKFDGETIAVQCKRNSANVGVKAVQEAKTAESHYGTNRSAVLTNSYFTKQAVRLAYENNVILWDREALVEFIQAAEKETGEENGLNALHNVSVHIIPIIDPCFPPNGIEIIINGNGKSDKHYLMEEKPLLLNLRGGNNTLLFRTEKKKKKVSFDAEANNQISFAAGYEKGKILIYKIKR